MMTELWLIRHGETDWNLEGRYQGQTDIPLNQTGIEQARRLSMNLPPEPFTTIYSSDLKRARMTGDILAQKLGLTIHSDQRLREINQGEWEGRLVSEIRASFEHQDPTQLKTARICPPRGETVVELVQRVVPAINHIACSHPGEKVIVVTHGLVIASLICQVKGLSLEEVYSQIPINAQETVIAWNFENKNTSEKVDMR